MAVSSPAAAGWGRTAHRVCRPQVPARVLEVGCGAGRTAFAPLNLREHGNYVGLDIDWLQIAACSSSDTLADHGFQFVFADVEDNLTTRSA